MKYVDQKGRCYEEETFQDKFLKLLYGTYIGRIKLKILTKPWVSRLGGLFLSTGCSKCMIERFVRKNKIDMREYEDRIYTSYNDFFTRHIIEGQRQIRLEENIFIAPADSKLTYYPITENIQLKIKDSLYSLEDLLQNAELAKQYHGGICLIFRLTVDDYHRYCFVDSGTKEKDCYIQGIFHTVNPIANDYYPIYKRNSRSYSVLHTDHFNDVIYMEVGAMMVGKIVNHDLQSFQKGQEKGYFEFGGSTIVVLLKKDIIDVDEDIIRNSSHHDETRVLMGEKIGIKKRKAMLK